MKKFVIKGIGEPFDGLVIHTYDKVDKKKDLIVAVQRIQTASKLFNPFSVPVTPDSLYISTKYLSEYVQETDDQQTDNPYGRHISDGKFGKHDFTVSWGLYEKALTVKVMNGDAVLYMQNFYGKKAEDVKQELDAISNDPQYDWDNVTFDLAEFE